MSSRHSLENNLALLQDRIRRDPASYKEEFLEQYRHLESTLRLYRLNPALDPSRLLELLHFHSHVAHCYPSETKCLWENISELLRGQCEFLHPSLRLGAVKALVLLRNRNLAPPFACLQLFFELCKCRDKELRKFLFTSTVQFIKLLNAKRRDLKMNNLLHGYILTQLQTSGRSAVVARMALLLLLDLYRRRVWNDSKTVNAIALGGCLNSNTKLCATACKFFLGKEPFEDKENSDDDDENDDDGKNGAKRSMKEIMVGFKAGKKTKKRKRAMERAKETLEKLDKRQKNNKRIASSACDVSALRLLYDPQEFAEQLFRKLEQKSKSDRFEFRLLIMALLARVIGVHKLQVLNFYTFLIRYMQPRQRDVTKILLFAAQASHDLVPPDVIEQVIKTIVQNFVTDRNSVEVITVGLNACREILANCPLAVDEDLLRDLVEYKKYKNKNVSMAARSLIQLFRRLNPSLLHKRDRGRPTEADKEFVPVKYFGETRTADGYVPGAEVLAKLKAAEEEKVVADQAENEEEPNEEGNEGFETDQDSDDGDDEDFCFESVGEEEDEEIEEEDENELENVEEEKLENEGDLESKNSADVVSKPTSVSAVASAVSTDHIFTDEELRRIQKYQLKKHLVPYRKRKLEQEDEGETSRLKKNKKIRKNRGKISEKSESVEKNAQAEDESESDPDDSEEEEEQELPRLADIEHLHKRPKMDKKMRMEYVESGREGREKFGRPKPKGPHVGRTNKQLARNKAFSMVRRKEAKKMKRRSFREKQKALQNYLIKQKKMR